jgi:hypothetical protein
MENIQHEFFIWEENKNIQLQNNNCKHDEKDNCFTTTETKIDLMQNEWKNITDPKLREKVYQKAYREANKHKIKQSQKTWYEINKNKLLVKQKDWTTSNKEKRKIYIKDWNASNKVKRKVYYESNKNKIKVKQKVYNNNNREKIKLQKKAYREINKDKLNSYVKNKRKKNIQYKLRHNLRTRLGDSIRGKQKSGSAVKDLGCTVEQLKQYLESKFQPGMTWDNWTTDGWHIDHIKPLSSFDLTDRKQLLEACHYTNLQPLWAKDNLSKSDILI